ncbi:MAG: amidase [Chloroflexi bacterium]|nr:amidase [Chloroflexota bacterium]
MDDLVFCTATQITAAIRNREVSASEVLAAQLSHIARHNPALNAIVTLDEAGARQRAKEADDALARGESWGPLHGLPVTIKDFFETAGLRSTCSHKPLAGNVPQQDAIAVARLRASGAIILGKTNLPELAMDFQTVSPLFGRTNNPWDVSCTPGGSTGGGAAAVAAGLSFLELASDLAGSIRIPAHFCGVYGLTPTGNLVPKTGSLPRRASGGTLSSFLRVGPLARSVADLQLCLSIIAGPDLREPEILPMALHTPPPRPLQDLRIAWTDDVGIPVTADTQASLRSFAAKLAEQGCHVEVGRPADFDFGRARQLHNLFLFTAIGAQLPAMARFIGRYLGKVEAFDLSLKRYLQAESERIALTAALDSFLAGWDAWLCPVTATPAFKHLAPIRYAGPTPIYGPIQVDGQALDYGIANAGFTTPFNVTGHPVVTMPIGQSSQGLPIGVQVVGKRWRDPELLAVAAQLAEVCGPLRHPPGYGGEV